MSGPPTGTITMVFTDIEGSTLALRRLGSDWGEALSAHRELLRAAWAAHDGHEIATEGDSFFVVFRSAREAALAAIQGQRGLVEHPWPAGIALMARMGIHTGEASRHEDGYIGIDVHRAARVGATAHGGQIVVSEPTRQLVIGVAQDFEFRDLGWHRLKDFAEPERLYDIVAPDLSTEFPPLKTLGTLASLPPSGTTLVGRAVELEEIAERLEQPHTRLVTLTGTGGSGKTRLAVAVAATCGDHFPSGIFFVPLHTTNRGALMWAAIADALDAGGDSDERPEIRTRRFLEDRRALLLLDNVEQISNADAVIVDLLRSAPNVTVLVTSRRALHLIDEYEYPVHPLELPASDLVNRHEAERSPAIELFVDRARMVQPRFSLTTNNTPDVVRLCRRLDGLPLAIELAAARSRYLSPKALLGRIDDSLDLGVTAADRTERQRTLGQTLAWSYDLLAPTDQSLFRRLGVFSRGFDLPAIEAVVQADEADPLEPVTRLIDANLLQVSEGPGGEPSFLMLQTVRAFARKMMKAAGDQQEMRLRHARWCLDVATKVCEGLHGPNQLQALDLMASTQHDIRTALDWSLHPALEVGADRPELAYQIINQMNTYWHRFGHLAEGRGWQRRAIAIAGGQDSAGLVDALHGMAVLDLQANDVATAKDSLNRSLEMAHRLGDVARAAREANSLGVAHRSLGDTKGSRALFEQSIELARQAKMTKLETTALSNMAVLLSDAGDFAGAVVMGRLAIAADRELGDPWGVAINQTNLAAALLRAEGPEASYRHLASCAADNIALSDPELSICTIEMLALSIAELGEAERAAALMGTADAQRAKSGMPRSAPDQVTCEHSLDLARPLISPQEWTEATLRGARLTIAEALDEALMSRPAVP